MKSSTDYSQEYQHAFSAYTLGNYEEAATIIDRLVEHYPDDPNARILKGHIYCYGLRQYDIAREQYELVPSLTDNAEFIDCANNGIEYAVSCQNYSESVGVESDTPVETYESGNHEEFADGDNYIPEGIGTWNSLEDPDANEAWNSSPASDMETENFGSLDDFDSGDFQDIEAYPEADPFGNQAFENSTPETPASYHDPFVQSWSENDLGDPVASNDPALFPIDAFSDFDELPNDEFTGDDTFDISQSSTYELPNAADSLETNNFERFPLEDETLLMRAKELENDLTPDDSFGYDSLGSTDDTEPYGTISDSIGSRNRSFESHPYHEDVTFVSHSDQNGNSAQEHFDFEAFDEAINYDSLDSLSSDTPSSSGLHTSSSDFLDEFGDFGDDLASIPDFDLQREGNSQGFTSGNSDLSGISRRSSPKDFVRKVDKRIPSGQAGDLGTSVQDDENFTFTGTSEQVPHFSPDVTRAEANVTVEQGPLAFYENAPLKRKPLIAAAIAGVVSAIVVAVVSQISANASPQANKGPIVNHLRSTGWVMTLFAGAASFGTTLALGRITTQQIKRATEDLQNQFESVSSGNFNAQATVYTEDEFGTLAAGFNQMSRVILITTSESQRKAEEQEQAKEDLQRQVIRLLDDVEGAARGDLTVQAEVTADVLGAVADSFNLTIQNLREIVQQVKMAARQVSKNATDSESFARSLSSDALRQAEELAVTLNSVQVMTGSIQRVAENAREAEDVARAASATALRGGESVERTVAGILQIRETVAETTRKVKRLAESSQEISKIVALISGIASRTNLLALNASIEAARAGEAGRGFAVVADEVRQLADRAAKALKEIEQIVLQIQQETGSVMTAMEEGTQQVIEGTKRAEQAKRSLEDIIQVSNRIDALVRSITADTVEQTETSSAVAQVMQSVELTAQETSQEAQRVSNALQNLVGVARDLLTSVERFRIEATEGK